MLIPIPAGADRSRRARAPSASWPGAKAIRWTHQWVLLGRSEFLTPRADNTNGAVWYRAGDLRAGSIGPHGDRTPRRLAVGNVPA